MDSGQLATRIHPNGENPGPFVLGLAVFGEPMPAGRLLGFAVVWVALSVFTLDLLRHRRRPVVEQPVPALPVG